MARFYGSPKPLGTLRLVLTVQRFTDNTKEVHNVMRWQMEQIIRHLAVNTRRKAKDLLSGRGGGGDTSQPGQPPKPHLGLLKAAVRFARINERRYRVFIMKWTAASARKIPGVLERGGMTTITGRAKRGVGPTGRVARRKRVHIKKRPSLVPALAIERKKLPRIIRKVQSRDALELGTARRKLTPIVNRVGV